MKPITHDHIRALRDEAAKAGDMETVAECETALVPDRVLRYLGCSPWEYRMRDRAHERCKQTIRDRRDP